MLEQSKIFHTFMGCICSDLKGLKLTFIRGNKEPVVNSFMIEDVSTKLLVS